MPGTAAGMPITSWTVSTVSWVPLTASLVSVMFWDGLDS
jgi:hypothetical protein